METLHITKIMRVGTSNAVVIPVNILAGLGWLRGDNIVFTFAAGNQLVLRKITDEQVRLLKQVPNTQSDEDDMPIKYIE